MIFTFVLCVQEWTDVNLKWNKSEYGDVEDIRIPPHKLWKPDVLMYNRLVLKLIMQLIRSLTLQNIRISFRYVD